MIRIYDKGYTKEELVFIREMLKDTRIKLYEIPHCSKSLGCEWCPVRYLCTNLASALASVDRALKVTKE